jgi:hypothetical protein
MPSALRAGSFVLKKTLIPHQNPNFINLLPLILRGKERTYFEIVRSDVDSLGNLTPVMKITKDFPIGIAVINNEKFTARWTGSIRHKPLAF